MADAAPAAPDAGPNSGRNAGPDSGSDSGPDSGPDSGKLPALTVLIGGGFEFETACLLPKLTDWIELHYLRTEYGGTPGLNGLPPGQHEVVPMFATVTQPQLSRSVWAFVVTLWRCFWRIRRHKIKLVFGFGCSHMVPMLLAARLAGCRTIYIETVARADQLSATGRIVYALRMAHTFAVQWPELQQRWRRSTVATIL